MSYRRMSISQDIFFNNYHACSFMSSYLLSYIKYLYAQNFNCHTKENFKIVKKKNYLKNTDAQYIGTLLVIGQN